MAIQPPLTPKPVPPFPGLWKALGPGIVWLVPRAAAPGCIAFSCLLVAAVAYLVLALLYVAHLLGAFHGPQS